MNRFAIALVLVASPAVASASQLVGANYVQPDSPLLSIDQGTGSASVIGMMNRRNVGDLTGNHLTGQVWGIDITGGANALVSIDAGTGAATGAVNIVGDLNITSIAFNHLTGEMYGSAAVAFNVGISNDILFRINMVTGQTTMVGIMGVPNVYALGFDMNGVLFGVSDSNGGLFTFSTVNGQANLIGTPNIGSIFDLAFRPEDNTMFASAAFSNILFTLNAGNGAPTAIGSFGAAGTNVAGLAFVPTPGAIGLLAVAGLAAGRRRRN